LWGSVPISLKEDSGTTRNEEIQAEQEKMAKIIFWQKDLRAEKWGTTSLPRTHQTQF